MKVIQAGPDSIHLADYCRAIHPFTGDLIFIGETEVSLTGVATFRCFSFRGWNIPAWIRNYYRLRRFLRTEKPDLVHVHQANRLAFMVTRAASALNIPVITTAWGSDVLIIPKKNVVFKAIIRSILKKSNIITADSREMIREMKKLAPGSNYVYLQYGIDPVQPADKEKIIYSNRLHEKLYRIDTIIREFSVFAKDHDEWTLCIGATGKETGHLKELAATLGIEKKVRFVGWLDKQANHDLYARSKIYVSIPESDGTSVSLLEAMSAGCLPVVADLPVSREWIEHEVNGVIYYPGENPFRKVLELDGEKCRQINAGKIRPALRTETSRRFFELYRQLV